MAFNLLSTSLRQLGSLLGLDASAAPDLSLLGQPSQAQEMQALQFENDWLRCLTLGIPATAGHDLAATLLSFLVRRADRAETTRSHLPPTGFLRALAPFPAARQPAAALVYPDRTLVEYEGDANPFANWNWEPVRTASQWMRQSAAPSSANSNTLQGYWCFPGQNAACPTLLLSHLPQITGHVSRDLCQLSRLFRAAGDQLRMDAGQRSQRQEEILIREMLELRTLTDEEFATPAELLEQFLTRLTQLTGFEHASLYWNANDDAEFRRLASGGMALPRRMLEDWHAGEARLLSHAPLLPALQTFDGPAARRRGLNCEEAVAVHIDEGSGHGFLVVSSRRQMAVSSRGCELLRWAAEYAASTFHKECERSQVAERARLDGLTRVCNRDAFDRELQHLGADAQAGEGCGMLLIDLDHFKRINDEYGHLAGDEILKAAADAIQTTVSEHSTRTAAFVARYGGEEFAVVLRSVTPSQTRALAEQVRQNLESLRCQVHGKMIQITASVGLATSPQDGEDPRALLAVADHRLYQAKSLGRNRVYAVSEASEILGVPLHGSCCVPTCLTLDCEAESHQTVTNESR